MSKYIKNYSTLAEATSDSPVMPLVAYCAENNQLLSVGSKFDADTLVTLNEVSGELVPNIKISIATADGTTFQDSFEINKDMTWHDYLVESSTQLYTADSDGFIYETTNNYYVEDVETGAKVKETDYFIKTEYLFG